MCDRSRLVDVLSEAEFEQVRQEICASGPPSSGEDLHGMEVDVWEYLGEPHIADMRPLPWDQISVRRSEGEPWLISAEATGARADANRIRAELSGIWSGHLAYRYRQDHILVVTSDEVCLHGVTQIDTDDFWVTVEVRVVLS